MKAKRLSTRRQKVKLIENVGVVLKAGTTGWITPNSGSKQAKDTVEIPDYIFRPDTNPELAFLVFHREVELISQQINTKQ